MSPLIEHFGRRLDVWNQVRARGLGGLAQLRTLRAAIGPAQAFMHSCMFGGRTPKENDSRDMHHVLMASPADVFVTDDGPLRSLLSTVVDLPFQVWSLPELVAWVRQR
jgi:hypothetical protein